MTLSRGVARRGDDTAVDAWSSSHPLRIDDGDVCCKWKLSMRTEDDPEYVPVELTTKRDPTAR